ncbi:MAG TPA: isoprenylcysteine carboxylmethyltransferase family protein [Allosphingosinicella sp.]|nr:isoprenylcysteine carboxylmethyltransferase family protein [Allosphingosinicella sp.]
MPDIPMNRAPKRAEWQISPWADYGERVFLLLLFGWFVSRVAPSVPDHPYNAMILASESFTAILVMVRRPGPMSVSLYAWLIAIAGTCSPLLVYPAGEPAIPVEAGALMMLAGLFLSFGAKLFLRRSFGIVAANRKVQRGGVYRIMRHPMYSGYVVTQLGFFLLNPTLWNASVYLVAWFAMVLRIEEEEKFLSNDQAYRDYKAHVRWRLFPGFY